jgi:hypothetical protein
LPQPQVAGKSSVIERPAIFKPYRAIVIYDAGQTSMDKLLESMVKEKVKFEDIENKSIGSVPAIPIPRGLEAGAPRQVPAAVAAIPVRFFCVVGLAHICPCNLDVFNRCFPTLFYEHMFAGFIATRQQHQPQSWKPNPRLHPG